MGDKLEDDAVDSFCHRTCECENHVARRRFERFGGQSRRQIQGIFQSVVLDGQPEQVHGFCQ